MIPLFGFWVCFALSIFGDLFLPSRAAIFFREAFDFRSTPILHSPSHSSEFISANMQPVARTIAERALRFAVLFYAMIGGCGNRIRKDHRVDGR